VTMQYIGTETKRFCTGKHIQSNSYFLVPICHGNCLMQRCVGPLETH